MLSEQVAQSSVLKLSSPVYIPWCKHEFPINTKYKDHRAAPVSKPSTAEADPSLKCIGANVRSMFAPANYYSICSLLESASPDLLFLVETWHKEGHAIPLPNRNYTALLSPPGMERGGGVGIISKYPLLVTPLFAEFHTRNLLMARLSSVSARPVILLCVYIPPDPQRRSEAMAHLSRVMEFLHQRYSSFSFLGFGDLNADLMRVPLAAAAKGVAKLLSLCRVEVSKYRWTTNTHAPRRAVPLTWTISYSAVFK